MSDELLTAQEVMAILKVSRAQAYRLMSTEIPSIVVGSSGRCIRVRRSTLDKWLSDRELEPQYASYNPRKLKEDV